MSDKHQPKLITVGDNCLDVSLTKKMLTVGGNALNVAIQWALNGWNSRYFGTVAPDPEGELVLSAVEFAGLGRHDVELRPGNTAVTLLKDEAGERRILLESLGVGLNYLPNNQRYQAMRDADWVHLGTHADERLVRKLVADGVPFSVDVSTAHFDFSLQGVPLVFASGPEDPAEPVEPLMEALRQAGAAQSLVTCGRRGAFFDDGQTVSFAPAMDVDVVDTCGAGDSFIASFLAAYVCEKAVAEVALHGAAQKAAQTCSHLGGYPQPVQPIPGWLVDKYAEIIRRVEEA